MKLEYEAWSPGADALDVIRQANRIVSDYQAQGYDLTLRQLYYQFVARDLIANTDRSYKRLGSIINRGRMAGLVDWSAIVDRTRNLRHLGHHDDPADIIATTVRAFHLDRWTTQPLRVEVWVEKEALAGVVERAASRYDVSWFSCRGYVSQSELWEAGRRHSRYLRRGQRVRVLHLGDHDPSGIDMTRDITDRLNLFVGTDHGRHSWEVPLDEYELSEALDDLAVELQADFPYEEADDLPPIEVRRIALNMDQIEEHEPPPNPAKLTDSRAGSYIGRFGRSSWELDALDPSTLDALIVGEIEEAILNLDGYNERVEEQTRHRAHLEAISDRYEEVVEALDLD